MLEFEWFLNKFILYRIYNNDFILFFKIKYPEIGNRTNDGQISTCSFKQDNMWPYSTKSIVNSPSCGLNQDSNLVFILGRWWASTHRVQWARRELSSYLISRNLQTGIKPHNLNNTILSVLLWIYEIGKRLLTVLIGPNCKKCLEILELTR